MKKNLRPLEIIIFGLIIFSTVCHKGLNNQYILQKITRGDIINTVSSTGTINAVRTVEVGTQVSGIIDKIYIDFNDRVHKGQLLAVLDTVLLKISLMDAQANMEKVKVQLEQAKSDYDRNLPLFQKKLISEAEFLPFQVQLKTQEANLISAQASLERAQRNLKYAFIRSPISGTVIQRNVEEGQTVAASLQAPVLFVIAEDLSKMEIHAQVDESDIGMIKDGQKVTFSVEAYPDKNFNGMVKQIRLQPTTVQNVVNYTVIIDAANNDNLLLPGMTATIDFIVEERKNVLMVPNVALHFQPSADVMKNILSKERKRFASMPDSVKNKMHFGENFQSGQNFTNESSQQPQDIGRVWYLDKDNNLAIAQFKMGATDGKMTEIVSSRNLEEGTQVIVGMKQNGKQENISSNNRPRGFRPF